MRSFDSPLMWGSLRTPTAHAVGGFTLLEVLVVVLIIGIIVTFAMLSLGSRALDDQLETEARRLQQLFALANEEAAVQGADFGWRQTREGYEFLALDESGQWAGIAAGPLRARALAEPLYLELRVEGRAVPPAAQGEALPQVLLLSSGDTTAFRVDLRAAGYQPYFRLEGDALGRLRMARQDAS